MSVRKQDLPQWPLALRGASGIGEDLINDMPAERPDRLVPQFGSKLIAPTESGAGVPRPGKPRPWVIPEPTGNHAFGRQQLPPILQTRGSLNAIPASVRIALTNCMRQHLCGISPQRPYYPWRMSSVGAVLVHCRTAPMVAMRAGWARRPRWKTPRCLPASALDAAHAFRSAVIGP